MKQSASPAGGAGWGGGGGGGQRHAAGLRGSAALEAAAPQDGLGRYGLEAWDALLGRRRMPPPPRPPPAACTARAVGVGGGAGGSCRLCAPCR